jgi:hypothetical protein
MTLSINDTQHNNLNVLLNDIMLSAVMLSAVCALVFNSERPEPNHKK